MFVFKSCQVFYLTSVAHFDHRLTNPDNFTNYLLILNPLIIIKSLVNRDKRQHTQIYINQKADTPLGFLLVIVYEFIIKLRVCLHKYSDSYSKYELN